MKYHLLLLQDLLERTGAVTSYLGVAPWEPKIIAVINCISGAEVGLKETTTCVLFE